MSIANEIQRLQTAKINLKNAIEAKGVSVPSASTIDTYSGYVAEIPTGSSQAEIALIEGSLTSYEIPSGTTKIRDYCFYSSTTLTDITIPDSVTSIGMWAFYKCSSIANITVPSGVETLDYKCFQGCTSLTSISLPDTLTSIGNSCFRDCTSLENIVIPSGVTNFGTYCFENCSGLTAMTFEATTPPSLGNASNSLGSTSYTFPIYVPDDSVEAYQSAYTNYASRITGVSTSAVD